MKILHCCISCFYIEGYNYQENILPQINKKDGHEVYIIASNFSFANNDNTKGVYLEPSTYINDYGINVERVAYKKFGISKLTTKMKAVDGLYQKICAISPDVILFHGTSSVEIGTLIRYKKSNPNVKIYIDSHADYYTSGTNWVSKKIFHGMFFSSYLHRALPYIEKILYISTGCGDFLREVYRIPEDKLEFYSLGGVIPDRDELEKCRKEVCDELLISDDSIIVLQAGKFDKKKKLVESLRAFSNTQSDRLQYVIAGSLADDIADEAKQLMDSDHRVHFVGWKKGDELHTYLNACDIYVQPGKVSAIAQDAICRSSIVILNNLKEYRLFVKGNGWLIDSPSDLTNIFVSILEGEYNIEEGKLKSMNIAKEYFDYNTLAARLYR